MGLQPFVRQTESKIRFGITGQNYLERDGVVMKCMKDFF